METPATDREAVLAGALEWALRWVDEIAWNRFNEDERERHRWAKETLAGAPSPFVTRKQFELRRDSDEATPQNCPTSIIRTADE